MCIYIYPFLCLSIFLSIWLSSNLATSLSVWIFACLFCLFVCTYTYTCRESPYVSAGCLHTTWNAGKFAKSPQANKCNDRKHRNVGCACRRVRYIAYSKRVIYICQRSVRNNTHMATYTLYTGYSCTGFYFSADMSRIGFGSLWPNLTETKLQCGPAEPESNWEGHLCARLWASQ